MTKENRAILLGLETGAAYLGNSGYSCNIGNAPQNMLKKDELKTCCIKIPAAAIPLELLQRVVTQKKRQTISDISLHGSPLVLLYANRHR